MQMQTIQFTQAQRTMSKVVDQVEDGKSVVIRRRNSCFLMWKLEDAREALGCCFRFEPEVFFAKDGGVSVWLPELDLHGEGATADEAAEDLIDTVIEYMEDWQEELHVYPNHAARKGWVRRLLLADGRDDIREIILKP